MPRFHIWLEIPSQKPKMNRNVFKSQYIFGSHEEYIPITIIRSTPHGHDRFVEHQLIPFHSQLVSTGYQVYCVVMCKVFGYICTK